MAQNEDTELRDLVMEAMEKNGSLAKIKAALRANIFQIFENNSVKKESETFIRLRNTKECSLAFSLIDEFLQYLGLSNTLFVFRGEVLQNEPIPRKELHQRLSIATDLNDSQPLLMMLLKSIVGKAADMNMAGGDYVDGTQNKKDEDNCTYIVNEDIVSAVNSVSDNSIEEKNKLLLRLQLNNSDTDSSSDSRDKSSSEYIPSEHLKHGSTNADIFPKSLFFSHLKLKELDNKSTKSEKQIEQNELTEVEKAKNSYSDEIKTEDISIIKQNDSGSSEGSNITNVSSPAPDTPKDGSIYNEIMKELDYSNDFTNDSNNASPKSDCVHEDIQNLSLKDDSSISEAIEEHLPSDSQQQSSIPVSVIKENINYQTENNRKSDEQQSSRNDDSSIVSIPSISNVSCADVSD